MITEPIKPVSLGFPALGHGHGRRRRRGPRSRGEVGELVCRRPWPGMTRGFWRDDERYLETYWRRFPGVWTHGDWASVDADGYWFLHGRSDDTLNIAGKRIGPAELESAAIGHRHRRRGGRGRRPARGEGRGRVDLLRRRSRARSDGRRRVLATAVTDALGKAFAPERIVWVVGAAEDALGEDRPPRGARARARQGSRRPVVAREPRVAGGDRPMPLAEQVALVTGGGRGIGANIARELAGAGMQVVGHGPDARSRSSAVAARDRRARARRRRLEARRRRALGGGGRASVDLLVCNAGISGPTRSARRPRRLVAHASR